MQRDDRGNVINAGAGTKSEILSQDFLDLCAGLRIRGVRIPNGRPRKILDGRENNYDAGKCEIACLGRSISSHNYMLGKST